MRVITFSRYFPAYHPRKGAPTHFVEAIWKSLIKQRNAESNEFDDKVNVYHEYCSKNSIPIKSFNETFSKNHTIRAGNRWKVGDYFSPRVWGDDINPKTGKKGAYQSKQIEFAPPIEIKKVWNIDIQLGEYFQVMKPKDSHTWALLPNGEVAKNDGLDCNDFVNWFKPKSKKDSEWFHGQIICWNETISY